MIENLLWRDMKKTSLHNAFLVLGLSHGWLACVAQPATTDPQADDSVDDLGAADGWSSSPFAVQRRNIKVTIAITADTIPLTGGALTTLHWAGLDRLTALSHRGPLLFDVPARDGETCDATCRDAVLARAAQQGGTLPAVVKLVRSVADVTMPNGMCARTLKESVTIDLSAATHGIHPDLEATYGFLQFVPLEDGNGVVLKTIPCM